MFKKKRSLSFYALGFLVAIALFTNTIAREPQPTDMLPPLIPYAPTTQQSGDNRAASTPSVFGAEKTHFFGTDALGRDVAAGVIHGTRSALMIGVGGMLLALLIGVPIGLMAGFYGDDRLKLPFWQFLLRGGIFLYLLYFLYVSLRIPSTNWLLIIAEIVVIILINELFIKLLKTIFLIIKNYFLKIKTNKNNLIENKNTDLVSKNNSQFSALNSQFPFDLVLMRLVEVIQAIPLMLWLLAALTVIGAQKLTIGQLILLIGFTSWISFAQITRGEMMRIRTLDFMQAAETIGMSDRRQMLRHALPNILSPILVAFAFGIAQGILLESTLSFIGLGLPPEQVTWGSLLAEARRDFESWWLVVFPGLAIFLTVYTLNQVGKALKY